uniref:Uncharacterized protein n=1 Tax=Romanomermis culicivorax TaxID=13658 RepID=A0A915KU95_ROMCU
MSESSYFEASEERTVCLLFDSTDEIEDDHNHSTNDEI